LVFLKPRSMDARKAKMWPPSSDDIFCARLYRKKTETQRLKDLNRFVTKLFAGVTWKPFGECTKSFDPRQFYRKRISCYQKIRGHQRRQTKSEDFYFPFYRVAFVSTIRFTFTISFARRCGVFQLREIIN